ncbi:hypothetical protein PIB19_11570 [Sphingomonas sp. 7/4-4]|uniref:hypothetical protein n=1 Tax=Sphingomonas sp. 7/4-4 TaxID=3018446 RepID=UPI0022F3DE1F|nr:hypothetical protein [Sphingomonas sp. 7/4-4]WBY06272.1 hypothetical protein PIB19_11570 [Sphingomonas sp. 7/4-4]
MRNFTDKLLIGALLPALACIAAPAAAQDTVGLDGSASDANNLPFARRSSELAAMGMMLQIKGQKLEGKRCFETGCLFIINQTSDYDAIGLYLDIGSPDPSDAPVWGPNLFRNQKLPRNSPAGPTKRATRRCARSGPEWCSGIARRAKRSFPTAS